MAVPIILNEQGVTSWFFDHVYLELRNNILSEHMYVFDRDVNNWLDMAPSSEYMYVLFYRNPNPRNDISLGMCDMSLA
jgi:hypothetical protein